MGTIRIIKRLLFGAAVAFIALFSALKVDARQTYISSEIVDLCDEYGRQYDIDKYLLIAIIECESSGNASAVSANGQYIGLMQLNKDTFSGDLYDPANNVQQGAKYIDTLRTRHDVGALMAYSYFCGEAGRCGFYTRKVINKFFELYCEGVMGSKEKYL